MNYIDFYRKFGVRSFDKLKNPVFTEIASLVTPKDSLVHFIPTDETEVGPEQESPLFNERDSSYCWHIEKLVETTGSVKHKDNGTAARIRQYHKRNRKIRVLRKFDQGVRDPKNLVVVNYALLQHSYIYTRTALSSYNAWKDLNQTLWSNVTTMASRTMRNQFIQIDIPDVLPEILDMVQLEKKPTLDSLEPFGKRESLNIFYLWDYCTKANHQLDEQLGKEIELINLVFIRGGKFSILNLGELQKWKKDALGDKDSANGTFDKAFMAYLIKVQELETVNKAEEIEFTEEDLDITSNPHTDDRTLVVEEKARELRDSGLLSVPEYKRAVRLANSYTTIKATNGEATLAEQAKVTAKDLEIPKFTVPVDSVDVPDERMLASTLKNFDSHYVANVLEKDIAGMVLNVQNSGVAVTSFKKERVIDAANKYDHYSVQLTPLAGSPSTVHMKVPVVGKDGKFIANGVVNYMAKQRGDLPIRKTKPDTVSLTSYYGKVFVVRSPKAVYNKAAFLRKKVVTMAENKESGITNVKQGIGPKVEKKLPLDYSGMANGVLSFTCKYGDMSYDHSRRVELYGEDTLRRLERRGHIVCGKKGSNTYITIDSSGLYHSHGSNGSVDTIGTCKQLLDGSWGREPDNVVDLKIFSTAIPVGVVLGYILGLSKLLKIIDAKVRYVPKGQRAEIEDGEAAIVFKDQTLIYKNDNPQVATILNGFYEYRTAIKQYSREEFDKKIVYQPVLESRGIGLRFIREIDLMSSMFIDPITDNILERRNEPRTFQGLLVKAVELLKDDRSPRETDTEYMRLKGYERIAGFVYKELIASIRKQHAQPMGTKSRIEMNPKAVWMDIIKDATTKPVEQLNPVHNLKEKELVTYAGDGGRSSRSMVASSRVYDPNDMGVISEATVDSGSVAINTYTSANPKLDSLRGTISPEKISYDDSTALLSTSVALSPGATNDDPKRANFINIQQSHGVACPNYKVPPLTTGYEQVMAHRVDPMFAVSAEQNGKVVSVSDTELVVEYKDGERLGIEIGTIYGTVNGTHVPHRIETDLAKGQTFKQGHILTWNTGYFERDYYNPGQVNWKVGALVTVALMESVDTLEDSCAISEALGQGLSTEVTEVRNITVDFDQGVNGLVKAGDEVDLETILCTLEDSLTADNSLISSDSGESLKALGQKNPKAKVKGVVERVEVVYYGNKGEMSSTLKSITNRADKERADRVKRLESDDATTGEIFEPINIEGRRLTREQAVIKVYITKSVPSGVGDKGVLGNQLKTIIGRVMTGVNRTESGEDIDVIFGRQSIAARIVLSPDIWGTTNKLLEVLSEKVADTYFANL